MVIRVVGDNAVIATSAWVARSFVQRLLGLMFRASVREGEAVIFYAASSIHMFFMRFPIDVIYTDKALRVKKVVRSLKPWLMSGCLGAYAVIECKQGTLPASLAAGDQLSITEA